MRWIESPHAASIFPGLSDLVSTALLRRGIQTEAEARAFLSPASYPPTPSSALPGMEAALERIASALRRREHLCVWGDFDVDGQTATAILVETLGQLGGQVSYHIPVRAKESHGVNLPVLKELIDHGAQLIVTCDTGISAHEAVRYARSRGVDMVITDHHDIGESLPEAAAVTNPKLLPHHHPLAHLPGAGVAYKLAEALGGPASNPETLLDLVALGTVADLAILRGETRYHVQRGLAQLRQTPRLGLRAMYELAEIRPENLTESHIGFTLGPRLNALGRLEDANPAVDLLTTHDPMRARVLAAHLEGLNAQRKLLCDQVTLAAEAQLRADPALLAAPVLILAHPTWPGGVVGIVAARLVERYGKPAILLTIGADGLTRGSARSIEGLHITEAIAAQKDLLRNYGGHPMAAGLGLETEKLPEFRRRLARTVEKMLAESQVQEAVLEVEGWLELGDLLLERAADIEQLAPFGPGNERLVLASRALRLESAAPVGKSGEHVRLTVTDAAGHSQTVLWWNGGSQELPQGVFDLAYTLRTSDYKGQKQVTVELADFRAEQQPQVEIRGRSLEVLDWRREAHPQALLAACDFPCQVWAEAEHKNQVNGRGRHELEPAETLVIWTTPPYGEVLREALERAAPRRVILVCQDPQQNFLERLAGVVKFVVNQRGGNARLAVLAAATGETLLAVRLGLVALSKQGQLTVELDEGGEVRLAWSQSAVQPAAAGGIQLQLEASLQETQAYRKFFKAAANPIEASGETII